MRIFSLVAGLALCVNLVNASPIFTLQNGTLTVTGVFAGGSSAFDIRGAALFGVDDSSVPFTDLLALTDSVGGSDPSAGVLPFGNGYLIGTDANSGTSLVGYLLFFDFARAVLSGTNLAVPGIFAPVPSDGIPDTLFGSLLASNPFDFSFTQVGFADLGNASIAQYSISAVGAAAPSTPEPATFVLFGSALIMAGFLRKFRR